MGRKTGAEIWLARAPGLGCVKTRGGQEADIEALVPSDPTRALRERETLICLRAITHGEGEI